MPGNLALVITELDVGGAERCLTQLACGLTRRGHRVEVHVLAGPPADGQRRFWNQLQTADVSCHFLHLRHRWQFPIAVHRLRRSLLAQAPDVVQAMLFHANLLATLAVGRRARQPVCWGVRVADPSWPRTLLERCLAPRADRCVCVSQAVADHVRSRLPGRHPPIEVIANGIDMDTLEDVKPATAAQLGLPDGRRWIACVGRLHPQKGLDRLLQHAGRLLDQLPDHNLLIVGEGPERGRLGQMATDSGYLRRIHFLGYREDVPSVLAAADLLLLPSRWEGMPNVVLEAMAVARPVVCTQTHGVAQLLGPLAALQMVPTEDMQTFINKAVTIARDPPLVADLGRKNQDRARNHFSLISMLDAYEHLYRSLCQSFQ